MAFKGSYSTGGGRGNSLNSLGHGGGSHEFFSKGSRNGKPSITGGVGDAVTRSHGTPHNTDSGMKIANRSTGAGDRATGRR